MEELKIVMSVGYSTYSSIKIQAEDENQQEEEIILGDAALRGHSRAQRACKAPFPST